MKQRRETHRALMRDLVLRGKDTYHADRAWRMSWIVVGVMFVFLGVLKLFEMVMP